MFATTINPHPQIANFASRNFASIASSRISAKPNRESFYFQKEFSRRNVQREGNGTDPKRSRIELHLER